MKSQNTQIAMPHFLRNNRGWRLALLVILPALLGVSFIASSSAGLYDKGLRDTLVSGVAKSVSASWQPKLPVGTTTPVSGERLLNPLSSSNVGPIGLLSLVMPQPAPTPAGPESIATYEANCTTARQNFTVDSNTLNVTVCAKAENLDPLAGPRSIYWVSPAGNVVQVDSVSSTSPSATRVISALGNWKAYLVDSGDGSARAVYSFTVSDAAQPRVDLSVLKYSKSGELTSGNPVSYEILVTNNGPDSASTVQLTDAVPTNLSYVSSSQDSGSTFTRTQETPTTTWEIASLAPGTSATFTITYTVTGAAGTSISNTANITNTTEETHSEDNTSTTFDTVATGGGSPDCSLDCPNDIVTTATTHGQGGGANVTFAAPEAVGTCGTVTSSPASGEFFPIGTTTVTSTSATGGGFCSFTVTVVDSAAPTIACPANITVTANSGQPGAYVPDPNGSSSNVGSPTTTGDAPLEVTGSREDGEGLTTAYPIGVTDITWIATDPSGRQATCTQRITVLPNQVLTITCPANVTANSPTGCDPATVHPGTATSNSQTATIIGRRSDNLAYSNTAAFNDPYPVGTTTITWQATDTDSQSASCTQTITVTGTDTTPPTLHVPPDVSATTSSCTATLDDELGVATAEEEDCGTVNITRSGVPTFECGTPQNPRQCESFVFPTGTTIITYTATNSSGLSTTGTQRVTVTESPAIPPTITAPDDLNFNTGPGATSCGVFVGDATLGTATANDNCPGVTVARTGVPAGNNFPVGSTTITYTATDASGNTATDTQTVTVTDDTPPVVTPPANVTAYTGAGATSCGTVVSDATLGTASASDNCPGIGSITRTGVPSGNNFPVGDTTVTYSVTDAHGNSSSATQTVTVIDNTPPVISCPANITHNTDPGLCSAVINPGTATATDNCDSSPTVVGTRSDNQPLNAPYPKGTTTITWTATDHATPTNNQSSCIQTITVEDHEAPVITTNGLTPVLWPANHAYHKFNVTDFVTAVTDNCDTLSVSNVVIQQVTSDEVENGPGSGDTFNDIVIAADCKSVQLRAERANNGDGRVYTITFKVTDSSGNVGTKTAKIHVPKNLGVLVVDSGPNYTVNGTCP
jgi:uncharacterized repeat protein (TIGR01451 family)